MTLSPLKNWLGHRGQRGLPAWSRWAPLTLLAWVARRRRAAGWYDRCTLALYRRIWVRGGGATELLSYAMFCRDLGRPLAARQVPLLRQALPQLSAPKRRIALDLLAEAECQSADVSVDGPASEIQASIRAMQTAWRAEFAQWLLQRRSGGICIVGNGGQLLGSGLGGEIDRYPVVVRFNQFRGSSSITADIGDRLEVWVTAPGYSGAVPPGVPWVVISGPEMAFKLQDWGRFEASRKWGARVLTVPLQAWSELVRVFDAPPSAGLLFLAWARSLLGSWGPIRAVGFGRVTAGAMPYHHADANHRPASRHNWPAERRLLRVWQEQGLHVDLSSELPIVVTESRALLRLPGLAALLGAEVTRAGIWTHAQGATGILAWGRKPSAASAHQLAKRRGLPVLHLEDGFLRSLGLGKSDPPLSIVVDDLGIYYDAQVPSRLEALVATPLTDAQHLRAQALVRRWRAARVSKYNHAREWFPPGEDCALAAGPSPQATRPDCCPDRECPIGAERYVLAVDQTMGDASIRYGLANPTHFHDMLAAALSENLDCSVWLKVHPEVAAGHKQGHFDLSALASDPRVRVLGQDMHPVSLIEHARAVYVVTSQVGFEGLLWGKRVRTFGMPFYAGWGLTQDQLLAPERRRSLSASGLANADQTSPTTITLEQLVHAALVAYPRYIDPETGLRCEVERVIEWMGLQRRMRERFPRDLVALGFSRWKRPIVRSFFQGSVVKFSRLADALPVGMTRLVWGRQDAGPDFSRDGLAQSVDRDRTVRLEDGFLRSVGLGADLIRPLSWVLDRRGIYYDATRPSDLEVLLQTSGFDQHLLARARALRDRLVASRLTKYNVGRACWVRPPSTRRPAAPLLPADAFPEHSPGRLVILVPGQVESDASLAYGAPGIRRNLDLLRAVRVANPEAYVIYKPHPDVVAGLRLAGQAEGDAARWCDEVLVDVAMGDLLPEVDEVHTLTSLTGFEALLRGRKVVCYGQPFYAGWGLTMDILPPPRRHRRLTLDELVAGVLILYPTYVSRTTGRFTTSERALDELVAWRHESPLLEPIWRRIIGRLFRKD